MPPPAPELVLIEDLKEHPRNYHGHPEEQVAHIAHSLTQYGQYRNIVIAKDSTILAGHGVMKAARTLDWKHISAIRVDLEPDAPAALKLLALDNELGKFAEIDDRELTDILQEVREFDEFGLDGTGFDDMMLANLLYVTRPATEIENMDAAAEWLGMPDYRPKPKDLKYVVYFRCPEDRQRFAEQMELPISKGRGSTIGNVWSCWWPEQERPDVKSVMIEG